VKFRRRQHEIEQIVELFRELWGDLALEASVSTYSTLCTEEQLTVLREKLENDLELRGIVSSTQEQQEGITTK
jgi:hypothetical protein